MHYPPRSLEECRHHGRHSLCGPDDCAGFHFRAERETCPSQRITVGMIGVGRQARFFNVQQFLEMPDVQILAVCDVDSWRLANGKQQVEEAYAKSQPVGQLQGLRRVQGLPRDPRPQGHRRGDDLRARPLARADGPGGAWRRARTCRWRSRSRAASAKDASSADAAKRLKPRVPRRQRAAVLPAHRPGRRVGPQRADRQGAHGDGGRAGQRRRLPAAAGDARAAGARLRALAGAGPPRPVHREAGHQAEGLRAARAGCGTCTTATA